MSLQAAIERQAELNAHVASAQGYGLPMARRKRRGGAVSYGEKKRAPRSQPWIQQYPQYLQQLGNMNGLGLSGGVPMMSLADYKRIGRVASGTNRGDGVSGGLGGFGGQGLPRGVGMPFYSGPYRDSSAMPGAYLGVSQGEYPAGYSGYGMSYGLQPVVPFPFAAQGFPGIGGGRRPRGQPKNPRRVQAGLDAAASNPWMQKVAAYRAAHPGTSQKEAMQALKGT